MHPFIRSTAWLVFFLTAGQALAQPAGLVAAWDLDEGKGAWITDASGNQNRGKLHDWQHVVGVSDGELPIEAGQLFHLTIGPSVAKVAGEKQDVFFFADLVGVTPIELTQVVENKKHGLKPGLRRGTMNTEKMQHYVIRKAPIAPELAGHWDDPIWADVPALNIDRFHEAGSDHRPVTRAKVVYDEEAVYVIFRVEDRYVRCVDTNRNGNMCQDSCVEFFVEPVAGRGYFNFEINCGGTILAHYNAQSGSIRYDPVELDERRLDRIKIFHSMPKVVEPEIADPVSWLLEFRLPYEVMEAYVGPISRKQGATWRANFYKCGDQTSQPHWAMWNEIPGELGFHKPEHFAPLRFE